ncbi:MAG: xanthine dehydrogenase small subunit [Planctomycetota bacterium]
MSPNRTLLEVLRELGLPGTKEGCAEGDCGACSVAWVERDAAGKPTYRAINSCLTLAPMAADRDIVTVEGLASGSGLADLHPVQRSMVELYGSQCGYCTPGFVMSLFEGYYRTDLEDDEELDKQLCGNLCRCTGYRPIREAGRRALGIEGCERAPLEQDTFQDQLDEAVPALPSLRYETGAERFTRPGSLAALLEARAADPEARLVAGATDLGLLVTQRFQRFPRWISTEAVPELLELRADPDAWYVGGAVTLTRLEEALAGEFPAIAHMLQWFASRQIRNRATLAGNIANASPIGDMAPVLLSLDSALVLASSRGERTVPLDGFFLAYRETQLAPDEVIRAIRIPRGPAAGSARRVSDAYKVSKRREMDISIVAGAFTIDLDVAGVITKARLAYGGVAATTMRARDAEAALCGTPWNAGAAERVRELLRAAFEPISDHRAEASYRRALVVRLFDRFVHEHAEAAAAGNPS